MSINLLTHDVAQAPTAGPTRGQAKAASATTGPASAHRAPVGMPNVNPAGMNAVAGQPAHQPPQATSTTSQAPLDATRNPNGQTAPQDPFIRLVQKAVQALQRALQSDTVPTDAMPAVADETQAQEALAWLAQFAHLMPEISVQIAAGQAHQEAIAGTDDGAKVMGLDGAGWQALFQAGEMAQEQMAAGQASPLASPDGESQSRMQALIAQMRQVADSLATQPSGEMPSVTGAVPEAATPVIGESSAPQAAIDTPPHVSAQAQPTAVPQPVGGSPAQSTPPPAAVPMPRAETAPTGGRQPAQASPGSGLDVLLKPLRGELHLENEFALKGPRLDGGNPSALRTQLLQTLDEQGKAVALTLNGTRAAQVAETVGVRPADAAPALHAEATKQSALNMAMVDGGETPTASLLRTAVSAVDSGHAVTDFSAHNSEQALKAGGGRAEGMDGTPLASASGPPPGGPLEQAGGPPRAQQAVMQQVIDRVKALLPGPASIRMVLQPESLGQLTVRLVSHQGLVSVRVLTENAEVQRMLDGNLPQLRAALADSGVKLEGAQVVHVPSQGQQQAQDGHGQRQPQPGDQQQARREATDEEQAELERLIELLQQAEA